MFYMLLELLYILLCKALNLNWKLVGMSWLVNYVSQSGVSLYYQFPSPKCWPRFTKLISLLLWVYFEWEPWHNSKVASLLLGDHRLKSWKLSSLVEVKLLIFTLLRLHLVVASCWSPLYVVKNLLLTFFLNDFFQCFLMIFMIIMVTYNK